MREPGHRQLIQAVIARHAEQSRRLEGWAVTVVAALLGLAAVRSAE